MESKANKIKHSRESRYYFWLSPYETMAFTRCPNCDKKSKIRKICLVADYKKYNLLFMNLQCKYCTDCDLIIVNKIKLGHILRNLFCNKKNDFNLDDYFIFGTIDRKDYLKSKKENIPSNEAIELVYPFKDVWKFEIRPAGWYKD
jgi:hypothetical protein